MNRKSDIIAKDFARNYIKNNFNGRKTYKERHPKVSDVVADVKASQMVSKDKVQTEIAKLLDDKGLTMDLITKIHKRNLEQSTNLSVSASSVDTAYKLRGYLTNKEDNKQTNIAIIVNK